MKKLMAVSVATLIAIGAINVNAADAKKDKINFTDIIECVKEKGICEHLFEGDGCNDALKKLFDFLGGISTPDFNLPDIDLPDVPEEDTEESPDIPEEDIPETDIPETDIPEEKPDIPVVKPEEKPEDVPESDGNISQNSYVNEILSLVNKERAANGLSAVSLDTAICSAADIRAKEIKSSFSHTRPDGRSCFTVLSDNGISYSGAGENIAYGQRSASEVMTAWMNSSGHRANILNGSFTKLGVGVYSSGGTLYFVQLFTY